MTLTVGAIAPNFSLLDANDTPVQLSDLQGQWVVLYFYPRDLTPGCTKEACGFRDHDSAFQDQQVKVIGISADPGPTHQKFITKHQLPFTLLSDPEAKVAKSYGAYGPKKFMGKEYEGIYRQTFVLNPEGQVAKIYAKVKPAEHAAQVLADVQSLMGNLAA